MESLFAYDFLTRALLAGGLMALVAPSVGIFFVVRRYAALADTLAHVSLAGVAGGLLLGVAPLWSALVACVLTILGMERLRARRALAPDTLVALFLFGGLALGVVLLGVAGQGARMTSYLFGSILTVTAADLRVMAIMTALVLALLAWLWRPLLALSLDEDVARVNGLPTRWLGRLLAFMGAVVVALSLQVVGVLLVGALMVIPVAAAVQMRLGFFQTWVLSVVGAGVSVAVGLWLSFVLNVASGASMVLCTVVWFCLAAFVAWLRE